MIPVGRLAPSPTGELHLGHAFSFLVAYWHTKSRGGRLVLRHEDVDVERAEPYHIDAVRHDLRWLGVEWDEERVQSHRLGVLKEAAEQLYKAGLAYPCRCTRGDLRMLGAPQQGTNEVRYTGLCRELQLKRENCALRFVVSVGPEEVRDLVFGTKYYDVSAECGDFLVLRKNGLPSYQLAVVVDDDFDGVTEIVRGADLLPSAARQAQLQRAFHYRSPTYSHVPLVTDERGCRLAKRAASMSLRTLREEGASPEGICAFVARSAGMQSLPAPSARARDYLATFNIRTLGTSDIRITPEVRANLTNTR